MDLDIGFRKNSIGGKICLKKIFNRALLIRILKWIPAAAIIAVSWYLSGKSRLTHFPTFRNADKMVHFLCFAGLAFWVSFAMNIRTYDKFWIPTVFVSLYGIIDEIHQHFTPGRSCSLWDWCADTTGAAAGALLFILIVSWMGRRE